MPVGTDIYMGEDIEKVMEEQLGVTPAKPEETPLTEAAQFAWTSLGGPPNWSTLDTRNFDQFATRYPRQWWAVTSTTNPDLRQMILRRIRKYADVPETMHLVLWNEADRLAIWWKARASGVRWPRVGDHLDEEVSVTRRPTGVAGDPYIEFYSLVTGLRGRIGADIVSDSIQIGQTVRVVGSVSWVQGDYLIVSGQAQPAEIREEWDV